MDGRAAVSRASVQYEHRRGAFATRRLLSFVSAGSPVIPFALATLLSSRNKDPAAHQADCLTYQAGAFHPLLPNLGGRPLIMPSPRPAGRSSSSFLPDNPFFIFWFCIIFSLFVLVFWFCFCQSFLCSLQTPDFSCYLQFFWIIDPFFHPKRLLNEQTNERSYF